jgi:signal transduction histidine kinase
MAISLLLYFIDLVLKSTVQKPKFITLPIKISYYLSIFFIPLGSMVIGYFIIIKLDFISILTSLFLLILNVVVFYLYNGVMQLYSQEYEKQILLQFAQSYRKEIEMLTETNKNISMLKHDMKNHLNHIFTLSEKKENDKIQEYIRRTEGFITNTYQIAQSENEDFNSILNYKLYNAKEMGIEVSLELSVPNSINMEAFDITVILGNLLDNAIENANLSDKKQISVSIFCLKGVLNISISNSYDIESFDNFNTTKKNKEIHGLGLKIIEMFVTKYKGVFEKKIEGDFVVIKCILFV